MGCHWCKVCADAKSLNSADIPLTGTNAFFLSVMSFHCDTHYSSQNVYVALDFVFLSLLFVLVLVLVCLFVCVFVWKGAVRRPGPELQRDVRHCYPRPLRSGEHGPQQGGWYWPERQQSLALRRPHGRPPAIAVAGPGAGGAGGEGGRRRRGACPARPQPRPCPALRAVRRPGGGRAV